MYRTGDLARWTADGELEFPGGPTTRSRSAGSGSSWARSRRCWPRTRAWPGAVVTGPRGRPGDKRLVAYVVPGDDTAAAAWPRRLREHAAARLPAYMVPSAFVVLDALPLTPNGKLDRAALPAPDYAGRAGPGRAPATVAGGDPVRAVRRGPRRGPGRADDDFFALGGHSLLAIQLVPGCGRAGCGAGGAGAVRGADAGGAGGAAGAGRPGPGAAGARGRGRSGCRCRSPSSGCGSSTSWKARPRSTTCRWRCGWPATLDAPRWSAALADVIAGTRCCARCSRPQTAQPYQQVVGLAELGWQLPVTPVAEADLAETVAQIAAEPFDLSAQVPLRAAAAAPPARRMHVLVLVVHHIATDGWSAGIAGPGPGRRVLRPGGRAGRRAGRRCRCSTPTTRSGSGTCSAPTTTRQPLAGQVA